MQSILIAPPGGAGDPDRSSIVSKRFTLSARQMQIAAKSGITVCLPWPADVIGEYGSGTFDGSRVSPESCDRVMDAWVAESLDAAGMMITSIIAGRAYRAGKLTPCVNVTLFPMQAGDRVNRVEWIDGRAAR